MVLTAYVGLSPVTGLFCHRRLADIVLSLPGWADRTPQNLTPASGRQDHTILPSAATSLVSVLLIAHRSLDPPCDPIARKTLPRPPHPSPTSVTIAIRPSGGVGWREFVEMICPTGEAKYFCKEDSTQKCPTGKSDREITTNRPAGASGQVAGVAEIGHSRGVATERPNQENLQHACLTARFIRRAARYLLPEFGLLQPAAAPDPGGCARRGWAQGHTLDARAFVRQQPARTRAGCRCPIDPSRSRRHGADPLDQLWRRWFRSLRRRSQRHRLTWERMVRLIKRFLPSPRVLHPWPNHRFNVKHSR